VTPRARGEATRTSGGHPGSWRGLWSSRARSHPLDMPMRQRRAARARRDIEVRSGRVSSLGALSVDLSLQLEVGQTGARDVATSTARQWQSKAPPLPTTRPWRTFPGTSTTQHTIRPAARCDVLYDASRTRTGRCCIKYNGAYGYLRRAAGARSLTCAGRHSGAVDGGDLRKGAGAWASRRRAWRSSAVASGRAREPQKKIHPGHPQGALGAMRAARHLWCGADAKERLASDPS
jgi:hypothetical protein